jgi:hypothetical protein
MTPSVVAANPTLETGEFNTHMLEAWNALPDKEANHEEMLKTWKAANEEFKDASVEEDKKIGAQEYDVIGKTKSLKKSLSLQTEIIECDMHGNGDQIVG